MFSSDDQNLSFQQVATELEKRILDLFNINVCIEFAHSPIDFAHLNKDDAQKRGYDGGSQKLEYTWVRGTESRRKAPPVVGIRQL